MTLLIDDIQKAINRHSAENVSNTPDYVLATFLVRALAAFDNATNLRALHMEPPKHPEPSVVTDAMVSRFLSWRLPGTFWPDCYISFDRASADEYRSWPTGTNLLDASQARAMLEHVLGAQPDQAVIHLTPHEVQSGSTRVDWAEGLIRQLPETHDGRNSWLLNYGSDADERQAAWAERNPNSPLAHAINLGEVTGTAPDARPKAANDAVFTGETGQNKQPSELAADSIEAEIQAKGLTAPRVTKARIDDLMARIVYTCDQRPNGSTTTLVHAFLDGDFYLATGVSACVSVANFDASIGRNIATANAESAAQDKLWELEGYALRDRLAQGGAA